MITSHNLVPIKQPLGDAAGAGWQLLVHLAGANDWIGIVPACDSYEGCSQVRFKKSLMTDCEH